MILFFLNNDFIDQNSYVFGCLEKKMMTEINIVDLMSLCVMMHVCDVIKLWFKLKRAESKLA